MSQKSKYNGVLYKHSKLTEEIAPGSYQVEVERVPPASLRRRDKRPDGVRSQPDAVAAAGFVGDP